MKLSLAVVVLVAGCAVTSAIAAPPSLSVSPATVHRGHAVVLKGSADGCAVGNTVTLISGAFVHTHDFAGLPAVFTKVKHGGTFKRTTTIPAAKKLRSYTITARCGGGNLGVIAHLKVIA
jgi:hypothetical protein